MLRAVQRSILLWEPDGPARKPPREAADLLLSVNDLFGLSEQMQRSINPDYVSLTIGNTTRGAVERAYEWLLPIISRLPETIVRLQSSTCCFLLLRAYGADGEERSQLKELSAPLLRHVQEALTGRYGSEDSVEAFALLMFDVASPNADRRRCARRVLQDAVPSPNGSLVQPGAWMVNLLRLDNATSLVRHAIKHMVRHLKMPFMLHMLYLTIACLPCTGNRRILRTREST
jgi:integrator complex subunit 1